MQMELVPVEGEETAGGVLGLPLLPLTLQPGLSCPCHPRKARPLKDLRQQHTVQVNHLKRTNTRVAID